MSSRQTVEPNPRFSQIREALPPLGDADLLRPAIEEGRGQAAVSLVLREKDEMEILFIRRAEAEGDPWSGHIALPGGRQDPSDPNLLHTAIRETEEETAIRLREEGVPLGRLDPLATTNPFLLPPLSITPFVFGVVPEAEARVANHEVDEVFWAPLTTFWDPESASTVVVSIRGEDRTFPCFLLDGNVVWGMTYRILTDFFQHL